jgi:hypothetical protein
MLGRKVIFFELNEVPLRIIDYYCQKYPNSCLAQKLPQCHQYKTYSPDTVLSPWVTWATLHRGVPATKHTINHFGQNLTEIDREFPPIWQILASQGILTGVFGSLHSYPLPKCLDGYTFYVPDSFASSSECFPENLAIFQEFNLAMTRLSGRNVSQTIPKKATIDLLMNLPNLGLTLSTIFDILQQLILEKFKPWRKNRRRTYQTVLGFDLFFKQLEISKPDFTTFFTNHVASSMHRYWAAAFPGDYEKFGYSNDWIAKYNSEIDFAMSKCDRSFSRLVKFVDRNPEYTLWIASSMGQDATTAWVVKTQLYLTNIDKFMSALGIPHHAWTQHPTMFPEVGVVIQGEWIEQFRKKIMQFSIEGKAIKFAEKADGFFALFFGHVNLLEKQIDCAEIAGKTIFLESLGLENIAIEDETNTNAYHIPEGSLLIYDPQDIKIKEARKQISSLEITPMLLEIFSIPVPEYMNIPEPAVFTY